MHTTDIACVRREFATTVMMLRPIVESQLCQVRYLPTCLLYDAQSRHHERDGAKRCPVLPQRTACPVLTSDVVRRGVRRGHTRGPSWRHAAGSGPDRAQRPKANTRQT
eukprot:3418515-Rhodomonas_salina.3